MPTVYRLLPELEPRACPFCEAGTEYVAIKEQRGMRQRYACVCERCGSIGPRADDHNDAVIAWNGVVDMEKALDGFRVALPVTKRKIRVRRQG